MKKLSTLILAFLLINTVNAQHTEVRKLPSHQGISVATSLNVSYIKSDKNEIVIDCEKKDHINLILTEIKNGILTIKYKPNTTIKTTKPNKVTVYSNSKLNTLKASSSATLHVEAPITAPELNVSSTSSAKISARHIKADNLTIDVTSSAKFDGHLHSTKAKINASSSGKVLIAGQIDNATIDMSSSANLDLTKTSIQNLVCNGSSSAKLNINTSSTLKSNLSSSASLLYVVQPTQIFENKTSSSGRLVKKS